MEWPNLSVIIPTYNRPKVLVETVKRLDARIMYSGEVFYYIGNDGEEDVREVLGEELHPNAWDGHTIRTPVVDRLYVMDGPRRKGHEKGLGGNLNILLMATPDHLLLQMDDDHHLMGILNLDPHVRQLLRNEKAGWIRLMGVANHSYQASLEGEYWFVDWNSHGDYSLYIPSNRPHIKHRRFHDVFGYYPEGATLGETEEGFCHQCRNTVKRWDRAGHDINELPHVCIPLNTVNHTEKGWSHVGLSWQGTEDDIGDK